MEEAGERKGQSGLKSPIATLKDFGITKHQSSEWQRLGAMSEDSFNLALGAETIETARTIVGAEVTDRVERSRLSQQGNTLKPHPAASHIGSRSQRSSGAAATSPHTHQSTVGHRPRRNVSWTSVRNRDPPIGDFFPKAESDLTRSSSQRA